jgi:hypothetical protein
VKGIRDRVFQKEGKRIKRLTMGMVTEWKTRHFQ